ncbi:MAG: macrolide transport system ATP-binding/permease protein, partial [Nocardioidaceae bacterium]|nr:macrolide transport system ATP-binding/permease protein [Nocardioidaceae bacterium]
GYLPQSPDLAGSATVGDVLDGALAPLHDAVARLETLAEDLTSPGSAEEYDATLAWVTMHDAWDADRRAEVAAVRLGLAALDRHRRVATLSGGQRSRLALAALLTRRPGCLILDEPTNHLDDAAMTLLEESVAAMTGVVVAASHDRTFLDAVCRVVVDLDPHLDVEGSGGNRFTGGYSDYLVARRQADRRWRAAFAAQREELEELRRSARTTARAVAGNRPPRDNDRFIHHFKGENVARAVSRRVKDAERRIDAVERARVPKPPRPLSFSGALGAAAAVAGPVVAVRDLTVTGRLSLPRLHVAVGDHVLVTGGNGAGKSTLLRVLAGDLPQDTGTVTVSARRTGFLPQDIAFGRPQRTALETYDAATGFDVPLSDLGLLPPRDLVRPVGVLSLGQQRRLALAILVAKAPDLLLLDEPTNHISLALAEELEASLRRSPGTVLLASHDRWLRRRWEGPELALSPCAR